MKPYTDNTILYSCYSVPFMPKDCETWRPHTVGELKQLGRKVKPLPSSDDSYYIYPKRKVQVNTTVYTMDGYDKKYITDKYGKNDRFFVYMAATGQQFLDWYEEEMTDKYCTDGLSIKQITYKVGGKSLPDVGKNKYIRYWASDVLRSVYPSKRNRGKYLYEIHDAYGRDVVLKLYVNIELGYS